MDTQFKHQGARKSFGMSLREIRALSKSLLLEWNHRVMEKATSTRLEERTNLEDKSQPETLQDPDDRAQPIDSPLVLSHNVEKDETHNLETATRIPEMQMSRRLNNAERHTSILA